MRLIDRVKQEAGTCRDKAKHIVTVEVKDVDVSMK